MKYIIDTSFFIALFLTNDINHSKAKEILIKNNILKSDIILNNFIIEETSTILTYKHSNQLSFSFLESIGIFNSIFPETWIYNYMDFYKSLNKKISFADSSIIYDWIIYNCELITFDKQQKNIFSKIRNLE